MFLDPLRFFLVDPHQIVPSRTVNTQQFVQLSMKGHGRGTDGSILFQART